MVNILVVHIAFPFVVLAPKVIRFDGHALGFYLLGAEGCWASKRQPDHDLHLRSLLRSIGTCCVFSVVRFSTTEGLIYVGNTLRPTHKHLLVRSRQVTPFPSPPLCLHPPPLPPSPARNDLSWPLAKGLHLPRVINFLFLFFSGCLVFYCFLYFLRLCLRARTPERRHRQVLRPGG